MFRLLTLSALDVTPAICEQQGARHAPQPSRSVLARNCARQELAEPARRFVLGRKAEASGRAADRAGDDVIARALGDKVARDRGRIAGPCGRWRARST
jgi:hypothetical protein